MTQADERGGIWQTGRCSKNRILTPLKKAFVVNHCHRFLVESLYLKEKRIVIFMEGNNIWVFKNDFNGILFRDLAEMQRFVKSLCSFRKIIAAVEY